MGELTEDYFLSVAREDFRRRQAVNFAVRLDGKLIGEAVLYHFDWRGGAGWAAASPRPMRATATARRPCRRGEVGAL